MARTPALSPQEATAQAVAAYGQRGTDAAHDAITSANRGPVRAWLTALGVPSETARSASLETLRLAWTDTHNNRARDLGATPEGIAAMQTTLAEALAARGNRSPMPPVTIDTPRALAMAPQPAPAARIADPAANLAAALAAMIAQPAALDADAVRAIVLAEIAATPAAIDAETLSGMIAAGIDAASQPRPLVITVNGTPKGTMPATRHTEAETLLAVAAQNIPAYLCGPAGSGKTTAAEQTAEALSLTFYMQGAASGAHEFLGFVNAHGAYQSTPFRQAFEHGGLFLADEIDGSDPAALLVINAALANGAMAFPDQTAPVNRHPDFRMVAAANTYGNGADRQYVGRAQLDAATLDRFAFIAWNYDDVLELKLAANAAWVRRVQAIRAAVLALSIRHVVSPRASIMGAQLLAAGMPQPQVETLLIWKGLTPADVSRIKARA